MMEATPNPVPTPDSVSTPDPAPTPGPVPTPDAVLDPTSIRSASSSALDLILDPVVYDVDLPNGKVLAAALEKFDPQPSTSTSSDSSSKIRRRRMTRVRKKLIIEENYQKLQRTDASTSHGQDWDQKVHFL